MNERIFYARVPFIKEKLNQPPNETLVEFLIRRREESVHQFIEAVENRIKELKEEAENEPISPP